MTALADRRSTQTAPRRGTARTARDIKIAPLDRQWTHAGHVACILGPLQHTTREAMVAAVRTFVRVGPHARVGLTLAPDARSWRYDPARADELAELIVVETVATGEADFTAEVRRLLTSAEPTGSPELPMRIVVAGEWVALISRHVLGDGFQMLQVVSGLIATAHGQALPDWLEAAPVKRPLTSALVQTFGRTPGRVVDVFRERRRSQLAPAAPAAGAVAPVLLPAADDSGTEVAVVADAAERAWRADPVLLSMRSSEQARRALIAWGREHAGEASLSTLVLAALRLALCEHGVTLDPATSIAVNGRRYLERGAIAQGNFAARLVVRASDPDSPRELSEAVARVTESGRPLATIAASTLAGRRRSAPAPITTMTPGPTHLGYSFFGRPMFIERLPWSVPAEQRRVIAEVDPGGPNQIGALVFQIGGGLQLSLSLHRGDHDLAAVEAAMRAVMLDPAAVLARRYA